MEEITKIQAELFEIASKLNAIDCSRITELKYRLAGLEYKRGLDDGANIVKKVHKL